MKVLLFGHESIGVFSTLAGVFYRFRINGRDRICHESNRFLEHRS